MDYEQKWWREASEELERLKAELLAAKGRETKKDVLIKSLEEERDVLLGGLRSIAKRVFEASMKASTKEKE